MEPVVDVIRHQPPVVQLQQTLESEAQVEMTSTLEVIIFWTMKQIKVLQNNTFNFIGSMTLFLVWIRGR